VIVYHNPPPKVQLFIALKDGAMIRQILYKTVIISFWNTEKGAEISAPRICDSDGGCGVACLPQCLKALCDFRGIHSHHTHVINYRLLLRAGLHG
jgi:hypothetical protein